MITKSFGKTNQMNSSETLTTQEYSFLERLFKRGQINDYTFDGWIQLGTEWVPTTHGLEKIGVLNEYFENCR
jgi:hypothetical protein